MGGERLDRGLAILTEDCCCQAGSSRLALGEEAQGELHLLQLPLLFLTC